MLLARRNPNSISPAPTVRFVNAVDDDEGAGLLDTRKRVVSDGSWVGQVDEADLVQLQRPCRQLLQRVDVDLVLDVGDAGRQRPRADLHEIGPAGDQRSACIQIMWAAN